MDSQFTIYYEKFFYDLWWIKRFLILHDSCPKMTSLLFIAIETT